jgi:arylsulfatase A-like enzyme
MTGFPAEQRVDPASLGLIQVAWQDPPADYDQETPERYAGDELYQFKLPYYGYDHVDMVTGHGHDCNGHYAQWLRAQAPEAEAWRDPKNQLPHNYACPQAIRTRIPEALYPTSFIRDRAIEYLEQAAKSEDPFFAFVSFPDPHHPFTPPGKYWDMYDPADFQPRLPYEAHKNPIPPMRWLHERWTSGERVASGQEAFMASEQELKEAMALSCGMITMIDDAIGEVMAALQRSGKADNTIVVFTSDHGDYLGDFNLLLKGALMLRSINNVSFIWADPRARAGAVSHALTSTVDIAPTIIERAGLKPYYGIQGKSLLHNLDGSSALRERLVIEHQDNMARMGFKEACMVRTLLADEHRLTVYKGETWGELYDHRDDPDETHNRWDDPAYAKTRAYLMEQLTQELLANVDQSPRARRRA